MNLWQRMVAAMLFIGGGSTAIVALQMESSWSHSLLSLCGLVMLGSGVALSRRQDMK